MTVYVGRPPSGGILSAESIAALRRDADLAAAQLQALAVQIADHEKAAAGLREQRTALEGGLEKIQAVIRSAGGVLEVDAQDSPELERGEETFAGAPTLATQIEAVIRAANEPLHYKEILNRLQANGIDVGGKDPAATLLSILANRRYVGRFTRFDRGIYTLTELPQPRVARSHPSKRRRRRVRTSRKAS